MKLIDIKYSYFNLYGDLELISATETVRRFRGLCLVKKKYICELIFYKKVKTFNKRESGAVFRDFEINKVIYGDDYIKQTFLNF